jgi:Caspase domain
VNIRFVGYIYLAYVCACTLGLFSLSGSADAKDLPESNHALAVRKDFQVALIGVEDYLGPTSLSGPSRDLCALYQTYVREIGVPDQNIRIYLGAKRFSVSSPCHGVAVTDATRASVIAGLSQQASRSTKDATFIVHFSGHGIEKDSRQWLLLSDASSAISDAEQPLISLRDIARSIQSVRDFPNTVAIFLDACRDTVLTSSATTSGASEPRRIAQESNLALDLAGFTRGVVFSSASTQQRSYIRPHSALGVPVNPISYFSWASVKALLGLADYTSNFVLAKNLDEFLANEVPAMLGFEFSGKNLRQQPVATWLNEDSKNIRLPARARSKVPTSFYFFAEVRLLALDPDGRRITEPFSVDIALSPKARTTTEYAAITPTIYNFPGPFTIALPQVDLGYKGRWSYQIKVVFMFHLWRSEFVVCDASPNLPPGPAGREVVTSLRENHSLVIDARRSFSLWGRQISTLVDEAESQDQKFEITRVGNPACAE